MSYQLFYDILRFFIVILLRKVQRGTPCGQYALNQLGEDEFRRRSETCMRRLSVGVGLIDLRVDYATYQSTQ